MVGVFSIWCGVLVYYRRGYYSIAFKTKKTRTKSLFYNPKYVRFFLWAPSPNRVFFKYVFYFLLLYLFYFLSAKPQK
eukprot:UN24693